MLLDVQIIAHQNQKIHNLMVRKNFMFQKIGEPPAPPQKSNGPSLSEEWNLNWNIFVFKYVIKKDRSIEKISVCYF